jgi:hypothetical protein
LGGAEMYNAFYALKNVNVKDTVRINRVFPFNQ